MLRLVLAMVLALLARVAAQSGRVDATVVASYLRADGCPGGGISALLLGPVAAPVSAQTSGFLASARSAVLPQTAAAPLTIQHDYAASGMIGAPCPTTQATANLTVDLTLAALPGGPHWLRLLWEEARVTFPSSPPGVGWRLDENRPGGFHWVETRASFTGRPLYLDVPVDLSQPDVFTVTFANRAVGFVQCGPICIVGRLQSTGALSAQIRHSAPVVQEAYGAPCALASGSLPLALAYDPFAVSAIPQVEAMLVVTAAPFQFRPAVLCVGASRNAFAGIPLPFDLTPIGAPGCALLQDMVLVLPAMTNAESYAALPLLPEAQLRGLGPIYLQWIVPDTVNALGLVFSNGVQLRAP